MHLITEKSDKSNSMQRDDAERNSNTYKQKLRVKDVSKTRSREGRLQGGERERASRHIRNEYVARNG